MKNTRIQSTIEELRETIYSLHYYSHNGVEIHNERTPRSQITLNEGSKVTMAILDLIEQTNKRLDALEAELSNHGGHITNADARTLALHTRLGG